MNRRITGVLILLTLFVLVGLEANFAHGDKEHDEGKAALPDTLSNGESFQAEQDSIFSLINERYALVEPILRADCYNCHSNQTDFPWYHSLPLVGGFMDGHIAEAMEHVDLTNGFPFGGHGDPLSNLLAVRDEIKDGEMPIFSYRIMHWGSLIEDEEQDSLFQWIDESATMVREFYERAGIKIEADEDHDGDEGGDHDADGDHDED